MQNQSARIQKNFDKNCQSPLFSILAQTFTKELCPAAAASQPLAAQ